MSDYAAMTKEELVAELLRTQSRLSRIQSRLDEVEAIGRVGSFECDLRGKGDFWSEEMYRLWGCLPGEISPQLDSIAAHAHEEDREFVSQQFASLFRENHSIEFNFRRILKNGETAFGLCKAKIDRDSSGDPVRILGFLQDCSERQALEEERRRDKKLLNETQMLSGTGGWELNLESGECHWTENLCRMLGYDCQDLPEDKRRFYLESVLHSGDQALLKQAVRRVAEEKSVQALELRARCKNGEVRCLYCVIKPDGIKDGKVQRILGANLDVTARKQSVDLLRRSEEKFRIIFERAPVGLMLFDEKGVILDCNPHFLKMVGASSSETYTGRNLLASGVEPAVIASFADAITKGKGSFEGYYTSLITQKTIFVQTLNLEVAPNLFLSVLADLTERKRAEVALQESEERYALIVKGSKDGIWEVDLRTEEFYHSTRFLEMLGYGAEEFRELAGRWKERVHPDDRERVHGVLQACLSGSRDTFSEEYRIRRKDGTYLWVHAQGMSAKNADGAVRRIVGAYSDISERKQAEVELIKAKEFAENASKAKNAFLANMSHEIRTPLNGILGLVQLLRGSRLNKEQKALVAMIHDTGKNLLRILNDILDLSRIEAGRLKIHLEPFSLDSVVREITGAFANEAKAKGLEFQCEVAPDVPPNLVGDVTRIRQVMYNLTGNALKYTETGSIRIQVYCLPCSRADKKVLLHVAVLDTGIGISDDTLESVFESFTQVETSYTKQYGGTGLGLAIVKNLVQRMGGNLAIASELGKGTEVHVSLELALSEARQTPPEPGKLFSSQGPQHNCTVLLVEDDPVNRIMAGRLLEKMGCTVCVATNGQEALDSLRKADVDCVMMDIQMPVMDGLEATRRIRTDNTGDFDADIPIVATTAYAMEGDRQKFLDAGMSAYLSKPLDIRALKEVLNQILYAHN